MRRRLAHVLAFLTCAVALVVATIGCHRIGSCEAMNVNGLQTGCSGPSGFVWDGSACIFTQACNCTGDDCQGLYQEREHCETAHTHCVR